MAFKDIRDSIAGFLARPGTRMQGLMVHDVVSMKKTHIKSLGQFDKMYPKKPDLVLLQALMSAEPIVITLGHQNVDKNRMFTSFHPYHASILWKAADKVLDDGSRPHGLKYVYCEYGKVADYVVSLDFKAYSLLLQDIQKFIGVDLLPWPSSGVGVVSFLFTNSNRLVNASARSDYKELGFLARPKSVKNLKKDSEKLFKFLCDKYDAICSKAV